MRLTGGTWSRTETPGFFLASSVGFLDNTELNKNILLAVNDLGSPGSLSVIEAHVTRGQNVLMDSGIFVLTNTHAQAHGCSMDQALALAPEEIDGFQQLWDRYVRIVTDVGPRCWGYIELDQGGRENKIKTRARLESMGLSPIPVYHPLNDGWDYFDELASHYDRICLGNVVKAEQSLRIKILTTVAERKKKYPGLWVHALGLSPVPYVASVGTESCDASTWLAPTRWPQCRLSSAMTSCAELDELYFYRRGTPPDDPVSLQSLTRVLGYDVMCHERMLGHHGSRVASSC